MAVLVTAKRMNREQFFRAVSELDQDRLRKAPPRIHAPSTPFAATEQERASALAEWHGLLLENLVDTEVRLATSRLMLSIGSCAARPDCWVVPTCRQPGSRRRPSWRGRSTSATTRRRVEITR